MRTVEAYFDYSSPFAYLGISQIERVAAQSEGRVCFRPFLLGALFRAIGTPMVPIASMPEAKRRYTRRAIERWAERWGVPFRFSERFPLRTVRPLRLTLLAPEAARPALIHRIMRAVWVEGEDPEEEAVLLRCLRDAGIDAGIDIELLSRTSSAEAKAALREATDRAIAAGLPGAPSFVVDGHLFWGQDRLPFVAAALRGEAPEVPDWLRSRSGEG